MKKVTTNCFRLLIFPFRWDILLKFSVLGFSKQCKFCWWKFYYGFAISPQNFSQCLKKMFIFFSRFVFFFCGQKNVFFCWQKKQNNKHTTTQHWNKSPSPFSPKKAPRENCLNKNKTKILFFSPPPPWPPKASPKFCF